MQDLAVILHNDHRGLLTIEDGRLDVLQLSKDGRPPKRLLSCRMQHLLRTRLSTSPAKGGQNRRLDIHTLLVKSGNSLRLSTMHVLIEPQHVEEAGKWVETCMLAAYPGIKPCRRILLLVNPVGGKGKAKAIVKDTVLPILEAAGCLIEYKETTHRLHAEEIARDMVLGDYDLVATASGDGIVYEILNGLAARPDAQSALHMPIAPIPTGSACSLCINLFGVADTFNIELACLNVIKGRAMSVDLISTLLLPSRERRVGFLSVALGLMVDLDIGTEHLRWMGDNRFVYGFVRGALANKNFKCRLRLKVVDSDKVEMARKAREAVREIKPIGKGTPDRLPDEAEPDARSQAPRAPLAPASELVPDETWLTIESGTRNAGVSPQPHTENGIPAPYGGWAVQGDGVLYMYAGMMPWTSRDLMQWPVATAGQGVMDVVVQSIVSRPTLIGAITGAEHGNSYWLDCQHYYKCSALVCENLDKAKQKTFTIDGEGFDFDSFHLEVLPRAANITSLEGHYFVSDFLKRHEGR